MAEGGPFEKLIHEASYCIRFQRATFTIVVHVLFQILLAELEDEDQLRLGVDDIVEAHDVDVLELLHERYFADRGRGRPFFCIEVDLFQRDNLIRCSRSTLRRKISIALGGTIGWGLP